MNDIQTNCIKGWVPCPSTSDKLSDSSRVLQVSFIQEVNAMAQQQQPDIADGVARLNLQGLVHRPDAVMYHVTNIRANEDNDNRYEALQTNIADDRTYDGLLMGLPVVCFTTTLYEDRNHPIMLPNKSPYPRGGNQGEMYKRVSVPLDRFQDYDWWEMRPGNDQVHLLFTNRHWSGMLRNAIRPIPHVDKQHYEYLQYHREGRNAGWHLNVYKPGPFVNISVLDEVQLDDECDWDEVEHRVPGYGHGEIVEFQQRDHHYRKERWILEKVLSEKAIPDGSPEAEMQSKVLRAAATTVVHRRADIPDGMDHQQLPEYFRRIANLLERAPADLLSSIYHILYGEEQQIDQ